MEFVKFIAGSLYRKLHSQVLCRLGFHGPKFAPNGTVANFCCWGCGHTFNSKIYKLYVVALYDGQEIEVKAVNEPHARTIVAYGYQDGETMTIDGNSGKARSVKVHRDNIKSVHLKYEPSRG